MSEADKIIESLKNSGKKVEEFYVSNKTSDKNVGSIEEDIRILQEKDCMWHYPETRIEEAIENIIADYTRQKQINEEHQKINGGLREKVKELEEERQLVGIPVRNKRDGTIGIVLHQWKSGSIAVLERINPRIINTHDSWNTLEIITDEVKQIQTQDNSIPTQKVIDVLQNNRNELFSMTYLSKEQYRPYEMQVERINKIEQELLEGEK